MGASAHSGQWPALTADDERDERSGRITVQYYREASSTKFPPRARRTATPQAAKPVVVPAVPPYASPARRSVKNLTCHAIPCHAIAPSPVHSLDTLTALATRLRLLLAGLPGASLLSAPPARFQLASSCHAAVRASVLRLLGLLLKRVFIQVARLSAPDRSRTLAARRMGALALMAPRSLGPAQCSAMHATGCLPV